jgi:hypothetical protein
MNCLPHKIMGDFGGQSDDMLCGWMGNLMTKLEDALDLYGNDGNRIAAKWGKVTVGDFVDVLDDTGKWCEAKVLRVDKARAGILVKYCYWVSLWEMQWIFDVDERVAPVYSQTKKRNSGEPDIRKCQKISVRRDEHGESNWCEAVIVAESVDKVLDTSQCAHEQTNITYS